MDTTELNRASTRRAITVAATLVIGLTGVGCLIGWAAPHLVRDTGPHPVLSGSVADATSILFNNLRVLTTPFLLALIGIARSRPGRLIGDLVVLVIMATSTLTVGIELGRWQGQLIPYIPQLPVEWAALAFSISAWLLTRHSKATPKQLAVLAITAVALITIAAAVETWCTPQRSEIRTATGAQVNRAMGLASQVVLGGCFSHGACAAHGHPLQGHMFPSPHQVRFRSAVSDGADRAHNNHRLPQEGSNQ